MTLLFKGKAIPTAVNHIKPAPMGTFYPYTDEGETGPEAIRRINTPLFLVDDKDKTEIIAGRSISSANVPSNSEPLQIGRAHV